MAKPRFLIPHFLFSFLFFFLVQVIPNPDLKPLMDFKSASDKANRLTSWNSTADLCTWSGVTCLQNRVSRLVLENLDLTGSFEPLTSLTQLRVLSLKQNRLSGPVPNLSNLTALKLLFLSHNELTGEFPASVQSLFRLYRLDLSFNNFTGEIPVTVNRLTHLLTLRLEENRFSGPLSSLNLPNLQDFNVSDNRLSGEIPESFSRFPESAFGSNAALCGAPMEKCKSIESDPRKPGSDGALASPLLPGRNPTVVASSPSSLPSTGNLNKTPNSQRHSAAKISPSALIAIILGDVLVLALVSLLLYCYFWRNYVAKMRDGKGSKVLEGEKIVYSSSPYPAQPGFERGRMVFFEGVKRFELEDLLRASAEMLGKGGFGTAYKAVLDDGNVVAVKRLKDANVGGKREFEQQMEVLGRLRHPNLVSLKAYYFAREEKLLVYDYMPNGSLFWLLHGNRGPGRIPLDWTTRLKIAAGAARGLAFIHNTCKTLKLTHGNIKSTNVLLDKLGNARVSDFGLSILASPTNNAPRSNGYRAPEVSSDGRKPTQKSDVYSYGVLLLEMLTGKCPSIVDNGGSGYGYGGAVDLPRWVQSVVREEWTAEVFDLELMRYKDIEEEMVGLLQIAMACTSASPDQRPKISHVVKMIEEIRGVEVSPCHDAPDSVSDSPCLSEDTCGAVSQ
ncbi:probable leucine-rich repeat receptor-like protein kinase At1g68400 [Durio zibethinus]|uniref:Probable leucine-rich repeat receptor-like protein kinase At1g68400 n=1 Tax=Durio zibethinus TaxID=66656 RepID=A0A6P5XCU1_DURZI|nr:probable leucine-rich repeat receptor-like protein kinase At1g68400 [Durio zibethinus]